MKKHFLNLNRIAATCKGNPLKASPIGILKEFFNYATSAEHANAFDAFCRAALEEKYCWRRGSPANLLHYSQQLELLIEAAYLLYIKPQQSGKQSHRTTWQKQYDFLKAFFSQVSIMKWKRWLQAFIHAALSGSSVADEMEAIKLYQFITGIKQLLSITALILNKSSKGINLVTIT